MESEMSCARKFEHGKEIRFPPRNGSEMEWTRNSGRSLLLSAFSTFSKGNKGDTVRRRAGVIALNKARMRLRWALHGLAVLSCRQYSPVEFEILLEKFRIKQINSLSDTELFEEYENDP